MSEPFTFDVFLSHSSRDKLLVRPIAERLKNDGLRVWLDEWEIRPGDSIPAKIEEGLERSRVLVLCMSANAFGTDWAKLESGTFRFRDPLNKQRRFLPIRLDETPLRGSLAQYLYISWLPRDRDQAYPKLAEACRPPEAVLITAAHSLGKSVVHHKATQLQLQGRACDVLALSPDRKRVLTAVDQKLQLWDLQSGRCLQRFSEHHEGTIWSIAWHPNRGLAVSGSQDKTVRLWDIDEGSCVRVFNGHDGPVSGVGWSSDGTRLLSCGWGWGGDSIRLWDVESGKSLWGARGDIGEYRCLSWGSDQGLALAGHVSGEIALWDIAGKTQVGYLEGHSGTVETIALNAWGDRALSGGDDHTVRVWDVPSRRCLRVLEGHTAEVTCVAWEGNGHYAISGARDCTVRLWEMNTGRCLFVLEGHRGAIKSLAWNIGGTHAYSGDVLGRIRVWQLSELNKKPRTVGSVAPESPTAPDQVEYTNAKLLLVGDTNAGKTGLSHRLATGVWKPSEDSTVGAWSTQWPLKPAKAEPGVDREVWLWDFGGQADQRLIHQLYMDRTALILLLFNADQEDVLPGLRDWQTALRRCIKESTPCFLVAGRIDTGFKASRGKLQAFAAEAGLSYHETSAKTGEGCDALRTALISSIPWAQMEKRTSPRIFKLIKDELLKLRDEGQVLHTFKELRELVWRRLSDKPRFTDETLRTVVGLLDGPGVVKELDYGTYILLAPEWINAYAQAVIRTLRSAENDLGTLPIRSIAEGRLIYQSIGRDGFAVDMKRLPPSEERVVLGEMERQLMERGLCLRQGDKLVFPSYCGRDRPEVQKHPAVFVSYAVNGFLDDIYATLVVKLADCESFQLQELWRDAADFVTLIGDHHMGVKLTRQSASDGEISVYFGEGVREAEQVIFAKYIHAHLLERCEQAQRLRHYVCPHCHTPKGNPDVLMKKLLTKKRAADVECDHCEERFPLWDDLEKLFASDEVRRQVEGLQAVDAFRLDSRRKGKLLALEVGARITSADQKCFEIPATEDEGIDMELEFTTEKGKGTGKRLYLQLKSGNSHLKRRKSGSEIFPIRDPRWVEYWLQQPNPVMLVIGTFSEADEQAVGREKLEFADVRWMEISSVLRGQSQEGKKAVKQIEFKGERLDMTSIRRWRDQVLAPTS